MNTPTPRTDKAAGYPSKDWEATSERLYVCSRDLERELSDMTARAEAAEAACMEKDAALASVNKFIREEVYREGGGQDEPPQPADQLSYDAVGYIREIEAALTVSPAETRSVIAGLREEVKSERDGRYEERYQREKVEAQRNALISSLNFAAEALESIPVQPDSPYWEYRKTAVEDVRAAVSGAKAGAKGADDLAELRKDKERLDFIEEIHSITDDSSPLWKSIATDIAEKGYRKAIDIARSRHP